jgi:hypothetical protein
MVTVIIKGLHKEDLNALILDAQFICILQFIRDEECLVMSNQSQRNVIETGRCICVKEPFRENGLQRYQLRDVLCYELSEEAKGQHYRIWLPDNNEDTSETCETSIFNDFFLKINLKDITWISKMYGECKMIGRIADSSGLFLVRSLKDRKFEDIKLMRFEVWAEITKKSLENSEFMKCLFDNYSPKIRKIMDQLYNLKAGHFFDVYEMGRVFRVNGVLTLMPNGVSFVTTIIGFGDGTFICSAPQDSALTMKDKFFNKIRSMHIFEESDITVVGDIERY